MNNNNVQDNRKTLNTPPPRDEVASQTERPDSSADNSSNRRRSRSPLQMEPQALTSRKQSRQDGVINYFFKFYFSLLKILTIKNV